MSFYDISRFRIKLVISISRITHQSKITEINRKTKEDSGRFQISKHMYIKTN